MCIYKLESEYTDFIPPPKKKEACCKRKMDIVNVKQFLFERVNTINFLMKIDRMGCNPLAFRVKGLEY